MFKNMTPSEKQAYIKMKEKWVQESQYLDPEKKEEIKKNLEAGKYNTDFYTYEYHKTLVYGQ